MQLEISMLMYGVYNVETLEKLITTIHNIHNTMSSHERLFAWQHSPSTFRTLYAHSLGLHHYSINSLLYLRTIQDKYITLYRELLTQLCRYTSAIRILAKGYAPNTLITSVKLQEILAEGYVPNSLITPVKLQEILAKGYVPNTLITLVKLQEILNEVRKALPVTNPNYDLVIDRLHLHYDMQLVTFGIDKNKNLIFQFLVFKQPYTQQPLALYQLETVPIPIFDQNDKVHSYMYLQVKKPCITLNSKIYISLRQKLRTCKRIDYEFYCEELFVVKHKASYSC